MITTERLRQIFRCVPEKGELFWLVSGSGRRTDVPAGTIQNGHREINVSGETYQIQRLIWLWVHGEFPPKGRRIRFEDGDCLNCGVGNLRLGRTRKEHNATFRANNPEANRRYNYTKNYQGMTIAAFETMLEDQGGVCAICQMVETNTTNNGSGKIRNLNVDHDHGTNEVRGILCSGCNRGLGLFADSPDRLRSALSYLERHAMKKKAAA